MPCRMGRAVVQRAVGRTVRGYIVALPSTLLRCRYCRPDLRVGRWGGGEGSCLLTAVGLRGMAPWGRTVGTVLRELPPPRCRGRVCRSLFGVGLRGRVVAVSGMGGCGN